MNLTVIANYIIKNYPKSCLAANGINELTIEEDCCDFFKYELIGICSCGMPEVVEKAVIDLLKIFGTRKRYDYAEIEKSLIKRFGGALFENELLAFMTYILDDKGLLEHGSSIYGCTITELGKMFLFVCEQQN